MLAGFTTNVYGRKFALHPPYAEIAFLYKQANSKLAVIANVGPMIAPVNRDAWCQIQATYGDCLLLPANLYSHDDQQKAWMSGQANVLNPEEGAGGRIASALVGLNGAFRVPVAVLVSGINTFMLTTMSPPDRIKWVQATLVALKPAARPRSPDATPTVPTSTPIRRKLLPNRRADCRAQRLFVAVSAAKHGT